MEVRDAPGGRDVLGVVKNVLGVQECPGGVRDAPGVRDNPWVRGAPGVRAGLGQQ